METGVICSGAPSVNFHTPGWTSTGAWGHHGSGQSGSQNAGGGGKRQETTPSHGVVIILGTRLCAGGMAV